MHIKKDQHRNPFKKVILKYLHQHNYYILKILNLQLCR